MLERSEQILKLVCVVLAALVLVQVSRMFIRRNPLAKLDIPSAPVFKPVTNTPPAEGRAGTNATAGARAGGRGVPEGRSANPTPPPAPPSRGRSGAGGRGGVEVPAEIRPRVDRITQTEILAPIIRPLPMALFGIAGKDAFLRGPNGQTGLLREGEKLGDLKLLRIGTNRVLIEYEGQTQELSVFSGIGSETLMPKGK